MAPHWNAALPGGDNKSDADDLGYVRELVARIDDYPLTSMFRHRLQQRREMAMAPAYSDVVASVSMVSGAARHGQHLRAHPSDRVIPARHP